MMLVKAWDRWRPILSPTIQMRSLWRPFSSTPVLGRKSRKSYEVDATIETKPVGELADPLALDRLRDMWLGHQNLECAKLRRAVLARRDAYARRKIKPDGALEETLSEIDVLLQAAKLDAIRRRELLTLMKKCILSPGFKPAIGGRSKSGSRRPRDLSGRDEPGVSEATTVPAGVDLYSARRRPLLDVVTHCSFPDATSDRALVDEARYVYVYNLPMRVNETLVREALCNIGTPESVYIYDTRGIELVFVPGKASKVNRPKPKKVHDPWRVGSPVNAIVRFESEVAHRKAVQIENKLFGVLCKSLNESVDGQRPMYIESASVKKLLVFTGFTTPSSLTDFMLSLSIELARAGIKLGEPTPSPISETLLNTKACVSIQFPSFSIAFAAFQHLRSVKSLPSTIVAFNMLRSKWNVVDPDQPGEYRDVCSTAPPRDS